MGIVIQLPAALIVGMLAMIAPGGLHNNGDFLKATPVLTWMFYWWLFYYFLSKRQPKK